MGGVGPGNGRHANNRRAVAETVTTLPGLADVQSRGTPEARQSAAAALCHLLLEETQQLGVAATVATIFSSAMLDSADNRRDVAAAAGALPLLSGLLSSGTPEQRQAAAAALGNAMIDSPENQRAVAAAGALPILSTLLARGTPEAATRQEAAFALCAAMSGNSVNQRAVAGALQVPLFELMSCGTPAARQEAAFALSNSMVAGAGPVARRKVFIAGAFRFLVELPARRASALTDVLMALERWIGPRPPDVSDADALTHYDRVSAVMAAHASLPLPDPSYRDADDVTAFYGAILKGQSVGDVTHAIPFRDPTDVPNAEIIRYHGAVAVIFREVGLIPLRDDSLVSCVKILAYYHGIAVMLREVGSRNALAEPASDVVLAADVTKHYGRLRDAWAYGSVPAMQCKLVLVGEPMAGKTSLLRALRTRRADPTAVHERTVGADVFTWRPEDAASDGSVFGSVRVLRSLGDDYYDVEPADATAVPGVVATRVHRDQLLIPAARDPRSLECLVIHAFDLGGQQGFRATQQVHLAGSDALYLLCVRGAPAGIDSGAAAAYDDERKRETAAVEEVKLWLHALCARAPDASALNVKVVVSCADAAMSDGARASLPAAITRVNWASFGIACGPTASDVHVVSSLPGLHGVDALREAILECVRDRSRFPLVYAGVPRYYLRLHAAARRLRRDGGTVLRTSELLNQAMLRVNGGARVCPDGAVCAATRCKIPLQSRDWFGESLKRGKNAGAASDPLALKWPSMAVQQLRPRWLPGPPASAWPATSSLIG